MSMRQRAVVVIGCTAMLVVLPFGAGASAKSKDGCKAISTSDVNAALSALAGGQAPDGTPMLGTTGVSKGYTSCTWKFPNGALLFIGVNKVSKPSKQDFSRRSKAADAEKVPGLKKSFYAPVTTGGDGGTITFIDGTTFVNLQYFTTGSAGDQAALKSALTTLAKKAAKKL